MPTLIERVRAITGSSSAISSGTDVTSFLLSGAKYVLRSLPRGLLTEATTIHSVDSSSGIDVEREWVFNVSRNGFPAYEQPFDESYAYYTTALTTDGSVISWYQATTVFPKYFWGPSSSLGKVALFIKPDPTTDDTGKIVHIEVPKLTTNTVDWSIDNYEIPAINYAASLDYKSLQGYYLSKASSQAATIITEFTSSLGKYAAALPTWTSPTMGSIPTTISASIAYTAPTGYSLPTTLTLSEALPTWTTPALGAAPASVVASLTYTKPTTGLGTDISMTETLPTWTSATPGNQPTSITASISYTPPSTSVYQIPPTITTTEVLPAFSTKTITTSMTEITSGLGVALNLLNLDTSLTQGGDAEYWLAQEDEAMITANLQIVNSQLDRARTALNREATKINKFQAEVQQEVQKVSNGIANYRAEIEREVQKANNFLKTYELDLQDSAGGLSADTEAERLKIQNWMNVASSIINRYSAEIQNEGARFSAEVNNYRADLEQEVANAQNILNVYQSSQADSAQDLNAAVEEDRLKIQNWASVSDNLVSRYQAEWSKEAQRVQLEIENYKSEIEKQVAISQNTLSNYGVEQTDSVQVMTAAIEQERLKIQNWLNVTVQVIAKYQAEVNKEVGRFSAEIDKAKGYLEEGALRISKIQILGTYIGISQQYGQASAEMFKQCSIEIDRHIAASLGQPVQQQQGEDNG